MTLPLVFLHGFLGCSADWEGVYSHLPQYPCICIDLPGHGSAPFSPIFDFPPPAPKFHLIGYSMGGRLAMEYAVRYPERVASLILISAHRGLPPEERPKRLEHDAKWAHLLKELPIDEFLREWYAQPAFVGHQPNFARRRNQNKGELASSLMHYSLGRQPIYQNEGACFVVGEHDAKFRTLYPNAHVIQGATHAVHLEKPKEVAEFIHAYLESKR